MNDKLHVSRPRDRFFGVLSHLAIHHKTFVFIVVGLLTAGSLSCIPWLTIRTTRQGMAVKGLAEQVRFDNYMENFGTPTQLIVLLQGDTDKVKAAADDAAAALSLDKQWVHNVFYKVDLSALEKSGLYYLKKEDLEKARDFLQANKDWLTWLLSSKSLAEAFGHMSSFPGASGISAGKLETAIPILDAILVRWADFLSKPGQTSVELVPKELLEKLAGEEGGQSADGGYILGRDKRSALLSFNSRAISTMPALLCLSWPIAARPWRRRYRGIRA